MSDLRDAARQALEALEGGVDSWRLIGPAIDALRAALAEEALQRLTDVHQEIEAVLEQPKPPPEAQSEAEKIAYCAGWWAAMAAKAKEQPEQEPVACPHRDEPRGCYRVRCQLGRKCVEPLFTHPPRREWRGLKEWEINDGREQLPTEDLCNWSFRKGVEFAEAALKEKNL